MQHKGRGKKYLTEEEIRIAEEKKMREKEWKVNFECEHAMTSGDSTVISYLQQWMKWLYL